MRAIYNYGSSGLVIHYTRKFIIRHTYILLHSQTTPHRPHSQPGNTAFQSTTQLNQSYPLATPITLPFNHPHRSNTSNPTLLAPTTGPLPQLNTLCNLSTTPNMT